MGTRTKNSRHAHSGEVLKTMKQQFLITQGGCSSSPPEGGRPLIFDVVSRYTELKRVGNEFRGLCPFHAEKTPSFTVNEGKSLWYCFGCGEGGDLIKFVEKAENLSFKDALTHLGVENPRWRTKQDRTVRDEAARIVAWGGETSQRIGTKLRELGFQKRLEDEFEDKNVREWKLGLLERQWTILSRLDDDLFDPECVLELYERRDVIERLLTL